MNKIYHMCDIWRLHGGEFTDLCFLVRNTVYLPTFLRISRHSRAGENKNLLRTVANYLPSYTPSHSETT